MLHTPGGRPRYFHRPCSSFVVFACMQSWHLTDLQARGPGDASHPRQSGRGLTCYLSCSSRLPISDLYVILPLVAMDRVCTPKTVLVRTDKASLCNAFLLRTRTFYL